MKPYHELLAHLAAERTRIVSRLAKLDAVIASVGVLSEITEREEEERQRSQFNPSLCAVADCKEPALLRGLCCDHLNHVQQ